MGWKENIEGIKFTIEINKREFQDFIWKLKDTSKDYNTQSEEYIGIKNTKVNRFEAKGRTKTLRFYLQGNDCYEEADKFMDYVDNNKEDWIVSSPLEGIIIAQPTKIKRVNKINNIEFDVNIIETISDVVATQRFTEQPEVINLELTDTDFEEVNVAEFCAFLTHLTNVINAINRGVEAVQSVRDTIQDYSDRVNNFISDAAGFIVSVQSSITGLIFDGMRIIALTTATINNGIDSILSSIEANRQLFSIYTDIIDGNVKELLTKPQKVQATLINQNGAMGVIAALSIASPNTVSFKSATLGSVDISDNDATEKDKIYSREDILKVADSLTKCFVTFSETYETLVNAGAEAQPEMIEYVTNAYFATMADLDALITEGLIEYEVSVSADTNFILLAKELYGDANKVDDLITYNLKTMSLEDSVSIKQGTTIKYLK